MGGNKLTISEQIIERQVGLMVRLIDDLLDVSRITSGKIMLQVHRVELASIIRDAVETSRPGIDSAGHTLIIDTPVEPVFLNADPQRLEQIIVNLLNNAAKYTTSEGHIQLTARRDGARLILSVKDDGIGMQPDMLSNVFDPFTQIDHSLKMSQGGLGVGLSIARRLVELHGGWIYAKSDGVGLGSEFIVNLPVA